MADRFAEYQRAVAPLPDRNRLWPLYGAGLENLGQEGRPIQVPLPQYGPGELLVRHDAVGLCFSDIKVILLGGDHPRIYRDMEAEPVTLGHEVTIVIGTFTGVIGDPSDHDTARPQQTAAQAEAHATHDAAQAFRVLDPERTTVRSNGEGLARLKEVGLPALGYVDDLTQLPHGVAMKVQMGGLLGLARLTGWGDTAAAVGDVGTVIVAAVDRYGGVAAIPCADLVADMASFQLKRRRSR